MRTINNRINDLIEQGVETLLNKDLLRPKYLDEIISLGFLIITILEETELLIEQRIILERLLQKINIEIYNYEFVDYFNTFYYTPQNIYKKDVERVKIGVIKGQTLIDSFRLRLMSNSVSGNSEDEYFFSRGLEKLLVGIKNFFNHSEPYDLNSDGLYYLFLNYVNTVLFYEKTDKQHQLKSYNRELFANKTEELFLIVETKAKWLLDINDKLYLYNIFVKERFNQIFNKSLPIDNEKYANKIKSLNKDNFIWFFNNQTITNREAFKEMYHDMNKNNRETNITRYKERAISAINDLCYYNINELNLIIPKFENVLSRSWFKLENYIINYNESFQVEIDDYDINAVLKMNDEELRSKFSKIIKNINPHILLRESTKSHGAHEISDMELPINYKDEQFYLCMPFKSGQELRGKQKPAEKHLYQILKPFTHFGYHTILLYVSAKEGTEYFYNAIKKMNLYDLFYIETIMGRTLVKLFKINKLI